jgi:hypothetical protein
MMSNIPDPGVAGPPKPLRLFILSHPRTASNLLSKLFSEHPKVESMRYPFLYPYYMGPEAQGYLHAEDGSEEMQKAVIAAKEMMKDATYQSALDKLEHDIAEAEALVRLGNSDKYSTLIHSESIGENPTDKRSLLLHHPGKDRQIHDRSTPRGSA